MFHIRGNSNKDFVGLFQDAAKCRRRTKELFRLRLSMMRMRGSAQRQGSSARGRQAPARLVVVLGRFHAWSDLSSTPIGTVAVRAVLQYCSTGINLDYMYYM